MRIEPIVLAGDRFKQPSAGVTDSTLNDSLELHDDELGPDGEAGSRLSDRLQIKYILINAGNLLLLQLFNLLVLILLEDVLQLLNVPYRGEILLCHLMRLYVLIIRLLIVRDDAQYVVHLVAPLLRLQATLVRMR